MIFEKQAIFEFDEAHPHCHCSVIQELPNRELMAVWYAGKNEAHKTVGLKASWKPLKGGQWTPPQMIHKTPNRPDGNEVIIYYQGKLYLYFNTVFSRLFPWQNVRLFQKTSEDMGRTWSEPRLILDTKGYTVRTKPIIVKDHLIIPTGREYILTSSGQMLITTDGINHHLSGEIKLPKGNCHQPAVCQLADGSLLTYLRTDQNYIYASKSQDLGETWDIAKQTQFYNPNSALDFVRTDKGEILLVWNNNPNLGGMMKSRKVIHIAYSPDEGKTWPIVKEIERDDLNGRFAYPAIIQGGDGLFHLTYTNRRKNITYVKFDLEWVKAK
jgi:predicted neuraminidase